MPTVAHASDFGRVALEAFLGLGSLAFHTEAVLFAILALLRRVEPGTLTFASGLFGVSAFFGTCVSAIVLGNFNRVAGAQAAIYFVGFAGAIATYSWLWVRHSKPAVPTDE